MTVADGIAQQLRDSGYAVIPGPMSQHVVTAAKAELGALLDDARWGSGFDGTRTKRVWAPFAVTRRLDQAALAPVVLDAVEAAAGRFTTQKWSHPVLSLRRPGGPRHEPACSRPYVPDAADVVGGLTQAQID
jgi:hypothetical protein